MGDSSNQLIELQNRISEEDQAQRIIELLRQYRHDVMNDLQLIRGFHQLNRTDQMVASIEHAVERAQKQTALSSFPDPTIALSLLETDIMYPTLDLEIVSTDIEKEEFLRLMGGSYDTETVTRLRSVLQIIGSYALRYDQRLLLDIEFLQNQVILIYIYGQHEDRKWIADLGNLLVQYDKVLELCFYEDHITLKFLR